MFFKVVQLALQLQKRLFKIELMFHAKASLTSPSRAGNRENWNRREDFLALLGPAGLKNRLVFGRRLRESIEALRNRADDCCKDMSHTLVSFLKRWLITAVAVVLAASIVPGIHYTLGGLIEATLLLGLLNAFVRPIMLILSLPLLIFTLGLFIWVINALLLYWVGHILRNFRVDSFGTAFWASLIISLVSMMLNALTKGGGPRIEFRRGQPRRPPSGDGGGPVIDV